MFLDPYNLMNESVISWAKVSASPSLNPHSLCIATTYQTQIYTAETICMEVATSENFMSILQFSFCDFLNSDLVVVLPPAPW
jgi:hypothetical protein